MSFVREGIFSFRCGLRFLRGCCSIIPNAAAFSAFIRKKINGQKVDRGKICALKLTVGRFAHKTLIGKDQQKKHGRETCLWKKMDRNLSAGKNLIFYGAIRLSGQLLSGNSEISQFPAEKELFRSLRRRRSILRIGRLNRIENLRRGKAYFTVPGDFADKKTRARKKGARFFVVKR